MNRFIIVALDKVDRETAIDLSRKLATVEGIWGVKVNALLRQHGYSLISELKDLGVMVFADLKLHDIPETVRNDCHLLASHQPDILTVHTSGGTAMIKAAVDELNGQTDVFGITILTSLREEQVKQIFRGVLSLEKLVEDLSALARWARATGIVCSGHELSVVKKMNDQHSRKLKTIVPGIRPRWYQDECDDQARKMTPLEAVDQGADYLVIGRPIIQADDPVGAAQRTIEEIYSERKIKH